MIETLWFPHYVRLRLLSRLTIPSPLFSVSSSRCHCLSVSLSSLCGYVCLYLTSNKGPDWETDWQWQEEMKRPRPRGRERRRYSRWTSIYNILNVMHQLTVTVWYEVTCAASRSSYIGWHTGNVTRWMWSISRFFLFFFPQHYRRTSVCIC